MIGSERPALKISEHSVDPRQNNMRSHFSDDFGLVIVGLQTFVGCKAVAEHGGASGNGAGDESADTGRGKVFQRREADAPGMAFRRQFDCADDVELTDGAASLTTGDRIDFRAVRDVAFVDFNDVLQETSVGIDHGAAKLLQHQPGGFVRAEAKLGLKLES